MRGNYGLLINEDTKLQRNYFKQMVELLGVFVLYKYPKIKDYSNKGELDAKYSEPSRVGCIFEEHVNQNTAKLLGWNHELQASTSIIHVPYDLENLQVGCLFEVPSALDAAKPRLFRVVKLSTTMIYPASVICELVPEYESNVDKTDTELFINTNFNMLYEGN